ncbi:hypothetical protein Q5752_005655 [Cryptotrichosporon argae]
MSDQPCTLTLADGTHYDLSSLSTAVADYAADASADARHFKLNVCRGVVSELWNVGVDQGSVAGFFSVGGEEGDFSIGSVSTNLTVSPTGEPMLVYEDGSPCPANYGQTASTAIRFICSPSDYGAGTPRLVAALPVEDSCSFYFEWPTHVACPTSPKAQLSASHYVAFGAIVAIAFFTWFLGHTLYNRLYLQRRGLSQFPLPALPSLALPSFRRSDAQPRTGPSWGSWRRSARRTRGYNTVSALENDEEEGFAARFSLDDEDEQGMEDARALGGEVDAWRGQATPAAAAEGGKVGTHQGLVDI